MISLGALPVKFFACSTDFHLDNAADEKLTVLFLFIQNIVFSLVPLLLLLLLLIIIIIIIIAVNNNNYYFMPPTSKKLEGHIASGLFVRPSVRHAF